MKFFFTKSFHIPQNLLHIQMHFLLEWINYFKIPSVECSHLHIFFYKGVCQLGIYMAQKINLSFSVRERLVFLSWTLNKQSLYSSRLYIESTYFSTSCFLVIPRRFSHCLNHGDCCSSAVTPRDAVLHCVKYMHVHDWTRATDWLQSSMLLTARSVWQNCCRLLLLWPPL